MSEHAQNLNNGFLKSKLPDIVKSQTGKTIESLKFIGGGSYGKVFRAEINGKPVALKTYRIKGSQNDEAEQLKMLRSNTFVPMPEVMFTYEDDNVSLLAMSFIEGKNVLNPAFLLKNKTLKSAFSNQVINGMLEWHSVTRHQFGTLSDPSYDTWYGYYTATMRDPWLHGLSSLANKGKFSKHSLDLLLEATELFDKVYKEPNQAVLIHGDLNIMNMMADTKSFQLTGFIDPCGACFADREYDLFQLRNMWGDAFGLYETYKSKQTLSEYADFKVAYYAAVNEASMRLKGGLIVPMWEILDFNRLKREMERIRQ